MNAILSRDGNPPNYLAILSGDLSSVRLTSDLFISFFFSFRFVCPVSTPAVVGICLGTTLLLVSVAAVSCLCYRGRHPSKKALHSSSSSSSGHRSAFETRPLPFRKPTAVRSPNNGTGGGVGPFYPKKWPSPTGFKSPLGGTAVVITSKHSPFSGNSPFNESFNHIIIYTRGDSG